MFRCYNQEFHLYLKNLFENEASHEVFISFQQRRYTVKKNSFIFFKNLVNFYLYNLTYM